MIDLQIRVARSSIYDRNRIRRTHKKPNYVSPRLRFSLNAPGSWHRFAPVSSRFVFFALKLARRDRNVSLRKSASFFLYDESTLPLELIAVVYVPTRSRVLLSALAAMRDRVADSYIWWEWRAKKNRDLCARVMRQSSVNWTRKRSLGRGTISLGSIHADYNLVTRSWAKVWLWFRENAR